MHVRDVITTFSRNALNNTCNPQGLEGKLLMQESEHFNYKFSLEEFSGKNAWMIMLQEVGQHTRFFNVFDGTKF